MPVFEASGLFLNCPRKFQASVVRLAHRICTSASGHIVVGTRLISLEHAHFWKMGDKVPSNAAGSKTCFVTVGATAPFDGLIKAILEPTFLKALHDANYTDLKVQHGYEGKDNLYSPLSKQAEVLEFCKSSNLKVTGFGFDKDGLDNHIRGAKESAPRGPKLDNRSEGAVMSHAGQPDVQQLAIRASC